MSVDMQNQLKGYFAQVDGADRPIGLEEVAERLEPVAPIPRQTDSTQNQWRGPRVALLAAAVAAVAVLIALLPSLTDGTTPSEDPASDPVSTTTVPLAPVTTIPSPPQAPEPNTGQAGSTDSLIWQQLTLDPEPGFLWGFGRLSSGDLVAIESDGSPDRCSSQDRGNFECDPREPPTGAEVLSETPTVAVVSPEGVVSSVALDQVTLIHENYVRDGHLVLAAASGGELLDTMAITSNGFDWDYRSLPLDYGHGHLYGHGGFLVHGETVLIWPHQWTQWGGSSVVAPILASPGLGEEFVPALPGIEMAAGSDDEVTGGFTVFTFGGLVYAIDDENTVFVSDDGFMWTNHGTADALPRASERDFDERWVGEVDGRALAWSRHRTEWSLYESSDMLTWTVVETSGLPLVSQNYEPYINAPEGTIALTHETGEGQRLIVSRDGRTWFNPPADPRPTRLGPPALTYLRDGATLWILNPAR